MSGGSRNKIPLVGNTGGASPCVRVLNHRLQAGLTQYGLTMATTPIP